MFKILISYVHCSIIERCIWSPKSLLQIYGLLMAFSSHICVTSDCSAANTNKQTPQSQPSTNMLTNTHTLRSRDLNVRTVYDLLKRLKDNRCGGVLLFWLGKHMWNVCMLCRILGAWNAGSCLLKGVTSGRRFKSGESYCLCCIQIQKLKRNNLPTKLWFRTYLRTK